MSKKKFIKYACTNCGLCVDRLEDFKRFEKIVIEKYHKKKFQQYCPGIGVNRKKINLDSHNYHPLIGNINFNYVGYSRKKSQRLSSSSGGILTEIICYILEKGIVQGVYLPMPTDKTEEHHRYRICTKKNIKDIRQFAQSIYVKIPARGALSSIKKFDGKKLRKLNLSEIGQIAGRAGRYLNDGSFGITGDCKEINADEVDLIENHKFEEIRTLFWRNSNLNFNNPNSLIKSLEERPQKEWMRKIHECEDEKALKYFLRDRNLKNVNFDSSTLNLLWECCQIPDFVKKTYGNHYDVIENVFRFLNGEKGKITDEFMRLQLMKLDKLEGNVDSLSNRIANVRTWSYVSNKNNWVENQNYWIEKTKHLEDRLSDRLHEELTKTFIDKRASILARGLKQDMEFKTEILQNNDVKIDDQFIGKIKGLKLELDLKKGSLETDIKSLKKAARQSIGPEFDKRIQSIIDTGLIDLKEDFKIYWNEFPIARLLPGNDYLSPNFTLVVDDIIEQNPKQKLNDFIQKWLNSKISDVLKSLIDLKNIKEDKSSIKALAYQLYENNGVLKREQVSDYLKNLEQIDRKVLRELGVKFGRYHVFLYQLIKPDAVSLRTLLWKNFHQKFYNLKPPTFGLNFLEDKDSQNKNFMLLCGFEKFDNLFVRIDILERLFVQIINATSKENSEIKMIPEMLNLLGCSKENFKKLLQKMGYKTYEKEQDMFFKYNPVKKFKKIQNKKVSNENPFKVLKNLKLG